MIKTLVPNSNATGRRVPGFSILKTSVAATAIVLLVGVVSATSSLAATEDVELAEKMIWGSDGHSSPASGRLLLDKAVAEGDPTAKRVLGLHLIFGWVLSKDQTTGFELLNQALEAGDAGAHTELGEIYLWGLTGVEDLAKAREYLDAASALGEPKAMRILGKQLVTGERFDQNTDAGLVLLERAASMNDTRAYVTLGELYLYGRSLPQDREKALAAFEAAAALGDGQGLVIFGEDVMWREAGPRTAERMLLRAAELGTTEAYAILAEGAMYGLFTGGAFSRQKYTRYAEKAVDAGEGRIAILEAERSMWGIGRRASGPRTITGLTSEADMGNAQAAKYLVALLRDGNDYNVRKSITKARAALEKYGTLLNETERAQHAMALDAAAARTPKAYEKLAEAYAGEPDLKSVWFGMEIYKANPNVAIYILQKRFKAQGTYAGKLSGQATRQTLRPVIMACTATLDMSLCNDSVMRPEVIGGLLAQN